MHVNPNPTIVSDYLDTLDQLRVNSSYQRASGIWPKTARSALIETIILGYPMPAMYVHQRYDNSTRKPFKDLVDGQQRTEAISSFFRDDLKLSRTLATVSLRGKTFSELTDEEHRAFMSYSLPIFVFLNASDVEVREAFRRINSFNAILNAEEKRHSTFNGPFKWFIHNTARRYSDVMLKWGVVSEQQTIRMRDAGIMTEIAFGYLDGLKTTKAQQLDALYKKYDDGEVLPFAADLEQALESALTKVDSWSWFSASPFNKTYHFIYLVLALIHAAQPVEALMPITKGGTGLLHPDEIEKNFTLLAKAIEDPDTYAESQGGDDEAPEDDPSDNELFTREALQSFVLSSEEKTNTQATRTTRFSTFYRALTGDD